MSVDAALSTRQLDSWHEVDSYPQDRKQHANTPATWDLRGLTLDAVKTALRRLFDRHESLRTTFHLRDGVPVRRVHPDASPPISHIDRTTTGPDDPDRTTAAMLCRAFAMTDELCWRGLLVTSDGAPMFLSMSFSPLILDVASVPELETQFRALIGNADAPR